MATAHAHAIDHVNLLLVGKTGNGKSSTGNSILGKKVFLSKSSTTSVTLEPKLETSLIDGQTITVTDVPGLSDTQFDRDENVAKARDWISKAVRLPQGGFHAIVLVIRFGNRFTEEDRESIQVLKSILGDQVIQDHSVCAITCGDNFQSDVKNGEISSFKEWCLQQSGAFLDLLNECGQRCVLFDNVSKDKSVQNTQRNGLLREVIKLQEGGLRTFGVNELEKFSKSRQMKRPGYQTNVQPPPNVRQGFELPMLRPLGVNRYKGLGEVRTRRAEIDDDDTEEETTTSDSDDEGDEFDINQFDDSEDSSFDSTKDDDADNGDDSEDNYEEDDEDADDKDEEDEDSSEGNVQNDQTDVVNNECRLL